VSTKEKKPTCPKCGGALHAELDINGRAASIGCINCGFRFFRGVKMRKPTLNDAKNTGSIKSRALGRYAA
jgi:transcription elongation factor Elf1